MLRTRVRRRTASSGVLLTVTHGLGTTLDFWAIAPRSARAVIATGAPYRPAANFPTANVIFLVHSTATTVTLDVTCIAYQGRLY